MCRKIRFDKKNRKISSLSMACWHQFGRRVGTVDRPDHNGGGWKVVTRNRQHGWGRQRHTRCAGDASEQRLKMKMTRSGSLEYVALTS
ncbi:hypothetical protein BDA96_01G308000 [Sorghum bicolor]|uniref:Uncharacterized protein n=2 Tax=Sorghum bicolor TaxID=4558 RepID=A0A921S1X9_SORBI|nr:hypothetical protein BDA96_01G308000 [Sorghum bicolor]